MSLCGGRIFVHAQGGGGNWFVYAMKGGCNVFSSHRKKLSYLPPVLNGYSMLAMWQMKTLAYI